MPPPPRCEAPAPAPPSAPPSPHHTRRLALRERLDVIRTACRALDAACVAASLHAREDVTLCFDEADCEALVRVGAVLARATLAVRREMHALDVEEYGLEHADLIDYPQRHCRLVDDKAGILP